jgi:hypothetical protein
MHSTIPLTGIAASFGTLTFRIPALQDPATVWLDNLHRQPGRKRLLLHRE